MKKQILFLAMFTLALIFAGTSTAWGQLSQVSTGTRPLPPLSCAGNANFLHPLAGVPYIYEMNGAVTGAAETVSAWTWFATKNPAFVTPPATVGGKATLSSDSLNVGATGELLDASVNYGVIGSATNSVTITWSPEILAGTEFQGDATAAGTPAAPSPTFVVGYGTGTACADNIQVYEINPILNFTIDIANIGANGATMTFDRDTAQCVDLVQSATYNSTSNEIDMNYGRDTLYFEVVAANFVTNFTPTFTLISGLSPAQYATVTLAPTYQDAKDSTNTLGSTAWTSSNIGVGNGWATGTQFGATNSAQVATGVSLFVRVIIRNYTYESLAAQTFTLAVDAQENNQTGIWDMEDADCGATPTDAADQVDLANHIINPRPQIEDANVPDANAVLPDYRIMKTGGINN